MRADLVLAGRATSSGQFLAGLLAAGELDTVGQVRALPQDLFPGVDPVVLGEVWELALAIGFRAGRFSTSPRFHRDTLARLQGELAEAGFRAMGGMVGRSLEVVAGAHPADDETERGEH
ncbi:hypothetical protein [Streptomyces sp. NPDC060243]|uniref:hypothetical protein n=1 Tax=Streptomyces sp. NPDC060243 TaxID=3347081 RepID=UPI003667C4F1